MADLYIGNFFHGTVWCGPGMGAIPRQTKPCQTFPWEPAARLRLAPYIQTKNNPLYKNSLYTKTHPLRSIRYQPIQFVPRGTVLFGSYGLVILCVLILIAIPGCKAIVTC